MNLTAAKAFTAAPIAFGGVLVTASQSGGITLNEWLTAALAGLVALSGVYAVPNAAAKRGRVAPGRVAPGRVAPGRDE